MLAAAYVCARHAALETVAGEAHGNLCAADVVHGPCSA